MRLLNWHAKRWAKKAKKKEKVKRPPRWVVDERGLFMACRSCGHLNEMPFLDCAGCHTPRFKPSKWAISINLSLILAAFTLPYAFPEFFPWKWSLYLLIAILFNEFSIALVKGRYRLHTRIHLWQLVLVGGVFYAIHQSQVEGTDYLVFAVGAFPDLIRDYPLITIPAIAAPLLCFLAVVFLRWKRKYGFVNSYRLVILTLAAVSATLLGVVRTLGWLHENDTFPSLSRALEDFVNKSMGEYDHLLTLGTISLVRIFLFEVFVFAAVRGFAVARREAKRRRVDPAAGLSGPMVGITRGVHRLAQTVENMVVYLVETAKALAKDILEVVIAFLRELFIPTLAMLGAGGLIYLLVLSIDRYVEQNSLASILWISLEIAALILAALVFLWCKTKMRVRRISVFYAELIVWLFPNMLVFFLLLSLTLWATSAATNRYEMHVAVMPYGLGVLTKVGAGLLVAMVLFTYIRRRGQVLGEEVVEEAVEPVAPVPEAPEPEVVDIEKVLGKKAKREKRPRGERLKKIKSGLRERTDTAKGKIAEAKKRVQADPRMHTFSGKARAWRERLSGKPAIVLEAAEARAEVEKRIRQLEALESSKDSVAPETYENLMRSYELELDKVQERHGKLVEEIEKRRAENLVELKRTEAELESSRKSLADLEKLRDVGALDEGTSAEIGTLRSAIESLELQHAARQKQEEWLTDELPHLREEDDAEPGAKD